MTNPYWSKRAGNISSSLFEREFNTRDNETVKKSTLILQRSYKDNENEWKNENIHFQNLVEIVRAKLLLEEAEAIFLKLKVDIKNLDESEVK